MVCCYDSSKEEEEEENENISIGSVSLRIKG